MNAERCDYCATYGTANGCPDHGTRAILAREARMRNLKPYNDDGLEVEADLHREKERNDR